LIAAARVRPGLQLGADFRHLVSADVPRTALEGMSAAPEGLEVAGVQGGAHLRQDLGRPLEILDCDLAQGLGRNCVRGSGGAAGASTAAIQLRLRPCRQAGRRARHRPATWREAQRHGRAGSR